MGNPETGIPLATARSTPPGQLRSSLFHEVVFPKRVPFGTKLAERDPLRNNTRFSGLAAGNSTGWAIALGIFWGIAAGVLNWLVMLVPFDVSLGMRRTLYLLFIGLMGSCGGINMWLIRPKNATADFVSGSLTGLAAAVLCQIIS
jgi:hypothetical protein